MARLPTDQACPAAPAATPPGFLSLPDAPPGCPLPPELQSGSESGSGSGSGSSCTAITLDELEAVCQSAVPPSTGTRLFIYRREVTLNISHRCITRSVSPWQFVRLAGCCDCPSGSGSGSGSGGGEGCCPGEEIPSVLYGTIFDKTGGCTCAPDSVTLAFDSLEQAWISDPFTTCEPGGHLCRLKLSCVAGTWLLLELATRCFLSALHTYDTCAPFAQGFTIDNTGPGATVCSGTFNILITY